MGAPLSPDLAAAAAQFGINPATLELDGGGSLSAGSVYEGTTRTKTSKGAPGVPTMPKSKGKVLGVTVLPQIEEEIVADQTRPVEDYYLDFYRKNPGDLEPLQKRLFAAGFYDPSLDWEDIRTGDWDGESDQAWKRAVDRAAVFYESGKKLTLDEVIDQSIRARAGGGDKTKGKRGSGDAVIRLSHPDDIRTSAMKVSSKTLGRGWTEEELDRFVLTYQQMERAAQSAVNRGAAAVTAPPSVEAATERAARQANPTAAKATDMVGAYDMIVKAMQNLGAQ